jgi:hypothetical protein
MPAGEWDWKFARNPDGWFGTVAVADGEIVGNYAGWAIRILLDGEERVAYSVGDVATDPAVRRLGARRGVYRSMTELFYETLAARGVPFCFGFPNARAHEISNRLAARTLPGPRAPRPARFLPAPASPSRGGLRRGTFRPVVGLPRATRARRGPRPRAPRRFHGGRPATTGYLAGKRGPRTG